MDNIFVMIFFSIGIVTSLVIIWHIILDIHDYYVHYKICKTNGYISKYRSIIDRFIEATSELVPIRDLSRIEVAKIDANICKLIDEYRNIK